MDLSEGPISRKSAIAAALKRRLSQLCRTYFAEPVEPEVVINRPSRSFTG